MEIFWRTIAYYNSATWLLQIVIILIGIVLTALLMLIALQELIALPRRTISLSE